MIAKILRFDEFSGRKPLSSRQGPGHWLFFCAAFTRYHEVSYMGPTTTAKERLNQIHNRKTR